MGEVSTWVEFGELLVAPLKNGLFRPKKVRGRGVKMVNMGELFAFDRITNEKMERVPLSEEEAEDYLLYPGDLLFARQSLVKEGAGRCSIFLGSDDPVTFEGHLIRARLDPKRAVPGFYYYFFRSYIGKQVMASIVEQVAAAGIRQSDLHRLKVPLLPLDKQQAISKILGTLDDKIELNRRMNATLEAIARALFKSWFVDFDPVRAKAAGRPSGLPPALDALFPSRLVDSELGEIPEGWEVVRLDGITEKPQYGYTASAKSEPIGPKFIRITDINKTEWIDWESVPFCEISNHNFTKYKVNRGDLLIARMADPGHAVVIDEDVDAVFASYLIRFKPKNALYARFLQYWVRSQSYWEVIGSWKKGTTRPSLNAQELSSLKLCAPTPAGLISFDKLISSIRTKVTNNSRETRKLATFRNAFVHYFFSSKHTATDI